MSPQHTGKTAIVTGGSRGIGRGIALALGAAGWQIVVNFHSNSSAADSAVTDIRGAGGEGLAVQADIGARDGRNRLLQSALDQFGSVDMLVNNAGMAPRQRLDVLETSEASYDEVMTVNLKGPFFLTQLIARHMLESGATHGKIVNIGSISAYVSSVNRAEYCISKAGMGMMTQLFADRLARDGIRVYELRPGIIETDMTSGVREKYDRLIADGLTPIRRWGTPDDVGRIVVALADDVIPYSTGEVINIDGGFHIRRL